MGGISGYSRISGFKIRFLSEGNKNGFEMHFECERSPFRIQTLAWSHPCILVIIFDVWYGFECLGGLYCKAPCVSHGYRSLDVLLWSLLRRWWVSVKTVSVAGSWARIVTINMDPPLREAENVCCLPPVWNLRTVIWFHFNISSLVFLPTPIALSVFSFFCLWAHFPDFFPENSSIFFVCFCLR